MIDDAVKIASTYSIYYGKSNDSQDILNTEMHAGEATDIILYISITPFAKKLAEVKSWISYCKPVVLMGSKNFLTAGYSNECSIINRTEVSE